MKQTIFIDTSVLCNLLSVPGKNQQEEEMKGKFKNLQKTGATFILPLTTVVETGNHIAQIKQGDLRREAAQRFEKWLRLATGDKPPFVVHNFGWGKEFLGVFLDGADSGSTYLDHATNRVGAGDLCILTELRLYAYRLGSAASASLWTLDSGLGAHAPTPIF